MSNISNNPQNGSSTGRQVIISVVALTIIGLGAWNMWSQSAPYHPDITSEDVTRGAVPDFFSTGN